MGFKYINVTNKVVHVLVTEDGRVKQVKGSLPITFLVSLICWFDEYLITQ